MKANVAIALLVAARGVVAQDPDTTVLGMSEDYPPTTIDAGTADVPTATDSSAEFYPGSSSGAAAGSSPIAYTTTTDYEECPTDEPETVTMGVTVTHCPECESMPTHTTVYTTQYAYVCPTGLGTSTYTITETCTGETPVFSRTMTSDYIPPNFTTTVTVCNNCAPKPTEVTLTVYCNECAGPTATPAPPAPAPAPAPSPGSPSCPGPQCQSPAPAPAPYPQNQTSPECPGGASCPSGVNPVRPVAPSVSAYYNGAMGVSVSGWNAVVGLMSAVMGGIFFML